MAPASQTTSQIGAFGYLIFWLAEQSEKSANLWLDGRRPAPLYGLSKTRISDVLEVMIHNDLILDYIIFPRHILVTSSTRFQELRRG
jgi:hypothetical protein